MNRSRILIASVGTLLVAGATLFSTLAAAGGNVGWSVSIGAPGFAVTAGQPAYGGAWYGAPYRPHFRPYYRPVVVAPPVVYRPYFAPVAYPAYVPRPVVYAAPPVVVTPGPYYAAPAPRPYRY